MAAAQDAFDEVLRRVRFLRAFLKKRNTAQVRNDEERATVKLTSMAWFNTQRPALLSRVGESALASIDSKFSTLATMANRGSSRARYSSLLKEIKDALLELDSKLLMSPATPTADGSPDFSTLIPDTQMQGILRRRWNECVACLNVAPLASVVMMGGLLEGLLLARINRERDKKPIYTAKCAPRDHKTGKTLPLNEWMLKGFIDVAHEIGWITVTAKDVSEVLRDYRNYIHPQKELSHGIELKSDDSFVLWEISKGLARQLLK